MEGKFPGLANPYEDNETTLHPEYEPGLGIFQSDSYEIIAGTDFRGQEFLNSVEETLAYVPNFTGCTTIEKFIAIYGTCYIREASEQILSRMTNISYDKNLNEDEDAAAAADPLTNTVYVGESFLEDDSIGRFFAVQHEIDHLWNQITGNYVSHVDGTDPDFEFEYGISHCTNEEIPCVASMNDPYVHGAYYASALYFDEPSLDDLDRVKAIDFIHKTLLEVQIHPEIREQITQDIFGMSYDQYVVYANDELGNYG